MKAYTDIEQSKKLVGILPITTIDFAWNIFSDGSTRLLRMEDWEVFENAKLNVEIIPCWSLAALLEVLPERVIMPYYAPYLQKEDGKYHTAYGNDELLCKADNPIDACVEMIYKLKEKKLLQC